LGAIGESGGGGQGGSGAGISVVTIIALRYKNCYGGERNFTYDPDKRAVTLELRGLDMADAGEIFDGPHVSYVDDRKDYGETRHITIGHISGRMVFVAWTQRGETCRIISCGGANEREQALHGPKFG
jgi:uncharacterized protein